MEIKPKKLDKWGRKASPGRPKKTEAEKLVWRDIWAKERIERQKNIAIIEAKKMLRRREYRKNPFQIIRDGILMIKTKSEGIKPFILNEEQIELLDKIEELWFEEKPIRIICLKDRQIGISTLYEAIICVLTGTIEGFNSLIITDDTDGSDYLADMSRLYHKRLREYDKFILPALSKDNPKELAFEGNDSRIFIDTARNVAVGHKYTFRAVHCSEQARFPKSVELMMLGLLQTIANCSKTIVFNESTANGVGNYFHREWKRAIEGKSDWLPIFFSWVRHENYRKLFDSSEEKKLLLNSLDEEEKHLLSKYKEKYTTLIMLEKLNWRRDTIKNSCNGSVDQFHQEYPENWKEAFLVSGRCRFVEKILDQMSNICEDSIRQGYFKEKKREDGEEGVVRVWENDEKGDIRIWKDPIKEQKYVFGIDVMQGRMVAASKREPDFNCAQVMEVKTMDLVAEIHGHADGDLFGEQVVCLAKKYNDAFLGIENNVGQPIINYCKRMNYYNLYASTVYDEFLEREQKVIGWNTNDKRKRLMINDLASHIREQSGKIPDLYTIDECQSYVIDDDGKTNAQIGCWDDRVVALAIAIQMVKHCFEEDARELDPEEIPGTFAWERKKILDEQKRERMYH